MPGYQGYGYYPDPDEERREREMDLTQDPEALAGVAAVRPPPPTMDLTQDPQALQGSPDWQRMNQSRVDMRDELDNPPPTMDLTRDPDALNSPMLRQQAAARPQPPPPPAAGMPTQGSLASLLPQRDPQMDSRWRTAENAALDRSGYMGNQKYGAGEAVRDFAPLAVGGTLDILLNKGRGLGALSGAAMQANAVQEKNRQETAKNAGTFALQARDQRASNSRANVAAQTEARQQQIYDLQNNPDNPQTAQMRDNLYAKFPSLRGTLDGLTAAQIKQNQGVVTMLSRSDFTPQLAQDAGDVAEGRQSGTNRAQDQHFPTRLNQEAGVAAATADARNQVDVGYLPQRTAAEVDKQKQLIPGKVAERTAYEDAGVGTGSGLGGHVKAEDVIAANPGLDFGDAKYLQDALRTRSLTKDVMEKIVSAGRSTAIIVKLHDAADAFQEAASNGDIKGAWNKRRTYNSLAEEYAGALQQITGNKSDSAKAGFLKLVPSLADPTAPEGVKALWDSIEANIDSNLGAYHIKPRKPALLGGDEAPAQPSAAPASPQSSMQGGRELLPPGNAPPIPGQAPHIVGAREVAGPAPKAAKSLGDGTYDIGWERPVNERELQILRRKGLVAQ